MLSGTVAPMAITSVIVTWTIENPDGSAPSGSVTFQLSSNMRDSTTGEEVISEPIVAVVVGGKLLSAASGNPALTLLANDDATTEPVGTYYQVTEELTEGSAPPWPLTVKHASSGGTMDLSSQRPLP